MKRCQKPKTSCSQRKRCRKPKRPLVAKRFECKTPFEFDIAFAVFIPLRVCVWPFGVYIPFEFIFPFGPFDHPYLCLHVHAPLYGFSAYVYVHPLMGFLAVSRRVKPYGIFMPFRRRVEGFSYRFVHGEWRHLGFSVRFAAMDTFWVLGIIRGV